MPCSPYALFQLIPSATSISICNPQATFTIIIKQDGNTYPGGVLKVHTENGTLTLPNSTGSVEVTIPAINLVVGEEITFTFEESFNIQGVMNSPGIEVVECSTPEIDVPVDICLNSLLGTPRSFLDDPTLKSYPDVTSVKWEPEVNGFATDVAGVFDWAVKVEFTERPSVILPFSVTIAECEPITLNLANDPIVDPLLVVLRNAEIPEAQDCITNLYTMDGVVSVVWSSVYSSATLGTFTWEIKVTYTDGSIDFVSQITRIVEDIGAEENTPVAKSLTGDDSPQQHTALPPASSAIANYSELVNVRSVVWGESATTNCIPGDYIWDVTITYWNGTVTLLEIPEVTVAYNDLVPSPQFWKVIYRPGSNPILNTCIEPSTFTTYVLYDTEEILLITNDYSRFTMQIVLNPALAPETPGNLTPPFTLPQPPASPIITVPLNNYTPGSKVLAVLTYRINEYIAYTYTGFEIGGAIIQTCTP